jgi:hypothetical protein
MVPKTWRWYATSPSIWSARSPTSDPSSAAESAPPGTRNTYWKSSARRSQSLVNLDSLPWRLTEETEQAVAAAEKFIATHAPEADEGLRNDTAFKVACRLFDIGLERETALEFMFDYNETKLFPSLDLDEIETIVGNAEVHRQKPIGIDNPGAAPAGFVPLSPEEEAAAEETMAKHEAEGRPEDEPVPLAAFEPRWRQELNAAEIPPIVWVVNDLALRRKVSAIIGPGGVAKSTLGILVGIGAATGRGDICGLRIPSRQRAWIYNQEDEEDDIARRVAAVLKHFKIDLEELVLDGKAMLAWNSGVTQPLIVAHPVNGTPRVNRKVLEAMRDIIIREDIGLLILDPLAELHSLNELDNGHMRMVLGAIRDYLAAATNCAVLVVAHTRKLDKADSEAHIGNLEGLRGASSQGGSVRFAATLYTPPKNDEKHWRFPHPREEYVRLDVAKNNFGPKRAEPFWFHRTGVRIDNGEVVGVLQPVVLDRNISGSEDLLEPLANAVKALGPGAHQWADVQKEIAPEYQSVFASFGTNAARDIHEKIMMSHDEVPVSGGKLMRKKVGQRWLYRFQEVIKSSEPEDDFSEARETVAAE